MSHINNHNVIGIHTPEPRQGVQSKLKSSWDEHSALKTENGRQAVVRNGYLPELSIQTGIDDLAITAKIQA